MLNNYQQMYHDVIVKPMQELWMQMLYKYAGQSPCKITDEKEILVIGFFSGGKIDYDLSEDMAKLNMTFKGAVAASWDGNKFTFFQNPNI